ncbi:MAG: sugar phosphate isomerase/epimerase [Dialister sp.]|nr:sugar phosphate isomerase/epimerase [Dialister sp.]
MKYFISDLIVGMGRISEFGGWLNALKRSDVGVEFTAFTHNDRYWHELDALAQAVTCPVTFHGPYVQIEATADTGSKEYHWLMESYGRVLRLAKTVHAGHVVFHYSQKQFELKDIPQKQENAKAVMRQLTEEAEKMGVPLVIENLCRQQKGVHLFTNDEYFDLFQEMPHAKALIDIGHANVNGLDVERFLATYTDRVTGFHVHNNDGRSDQHLDYHHGTADVRQIMHWAGKYTPGANIVIEYEPHELLSHQELLEEIEELRSWAEEDQ